MRRFSLVLLAIILAPLGSIFAQEIGSNQQASEQPIVERPFRRIFVPQSDLPESQLDNLRPLEIDKLPAALERIVRRNTESMDPLGSSKQSLYSLHAVAQLIGADLLSERTKLVWEPSTNRPYTGGTDLQAREKLKPWNLAIEDILEESNSQKASGQVKPSNDRIGETDLNPGNTLANSSPTWLYDSSGQPYVQKSSNETWVRWSLRASSGSAPNQLNYEAQIPKTVDGCLVLLLPRSAKIDNASVVVRELDGWESAVRRLGSWPDQNPLLGTSLGTTVGSRYWLLEISGQEIISFTIDLGQGSSRGQLLDLPKEWGIDRLFSKQTMQYSVHAQEMRIIGEWEWNETSGAGQGIQLELPEGVKVRSIAINDRETAIALDDKRMIVSVPESSPSASIGTGARLRMTAEFLTSINQLQTDASGNFLIPTIKTTNGTIVSGTTILQDQFDGRFVGIDPERGKLESVRKNSDGLHRFEFSWHRNAPTFRCDIQKQALQTELESVAGIRIDSNRCVANVRIRLPSPRSIVGEILSVPGGWTIDAKAITVKPQSASGIASFDESNNTIKIDGRKVSSTDATIEFQISKNLDTPAELDLSNLPWISVSNQKVRRCLYVEPDASNRLSFRGRTTQWVLPEQELTPWQRESLPRLSRALVFGTREDGLPPLVVSSIEEKLVMPIDIRVRRANNLWKLEHRFELSSDWLELPQIRIELPAGFTWYYESSERLPIANSFDPESGQWVVDTRSLINQSDKEDFGVIVAVRSEPVDSESLQLDVPRVREAQRTTYELKLTDPLVLKSSAGITAGIEQDNSGYTYRWIQVAPKAMSEEHKKQEPSQLEIIESNQPKDRSVYLYDTSLDLLIDSFAHQVAEIQTKLVLPDFQGNELKIFHPEGWQITDCFIVHEDQKQNVPWFEDSMKSSKIVIDHASESAAPLLHVRLVGPQAAFEKDSFQFLPQWLSSSVHRNVKFSIPDIRLGEEGFEFSRLAVWYPEPLTLKIPHFGRPLSGGIWPVWSWTSRTLGSIAQPEDKNEQSVFGPNTGTRTSDILPTGHWKKTSLEEFQVVAKQEMVLVLSDQSSWGAWLTVFAAVFSSSFFVRWPKVLLGLAMALWVGSVWLDTPYSTICQQIFVGTASGALLYLLYQIVHPISVSSSSNARSDRSSTWAWSLLPFGLISMVLAQPNRGLSQDPADSTARVFDILIPISPDGELAGTNIYVPEELLKIIEQDDREKRQRDSVGLLASSKHNLRLDSRTFGFGNADQPLTSTYEFWISDSAVGKAIRIPFPSESVKLSRFSVDGIEVLSGRLTKTDTELIWFPDRAGRRAVQIDAQVRMRSLDAADSSPSFGNQAFTNLAIASGTLGTEKRGAKVWGIATNILPVANSILEVETDGAWWISVAACGRSANPAQGRVVIQLGNKSRIEGFFQPPTSSPNRTSTLAMPSDSSPSGGEVPTMNTELFLDSDQLLAKTVIEFPQNMVLAGEIEIESDSQWLPIGTQWGDAQLIDVRTGSTLDRKRYAMRWRNLEPSGSETISPNTQKKVITTTWIPMGDSGIRNILFAECRDRRVRQGVLRYSRSPGSIWTLDGISSWIPAINSKERLDWPELKDPPLTTNLRIPISSGFGVLRRQSLEPLQQLSATSRVHLESQRTRLTTTIKLDGSLGQRAPLLFEIPNKYQVQNVLSPSGTLDFLTWVKDSKSYLQVLVDRQSNLIGELTIESKSSLPIGDTEAFGFDWPEIKASTGWANTIPMSLSADPSWTILDDGFNQATKRLQGAGQGRVLLLTKDENDRRPSIRIQRAEPKWEGTLLIKSSQSESGQQVLQIVGFQPQRASGDWYGLELSIPRELSSSWTSKNPSAELTNLRWNHRLLLIEPVPTALVDQPQSIDFMIELTPEQSIRLDPLFFEQIEINGRKPSELYLAYQEPDILSGLAQDRQPIAQKLDGPIRMAIGITEDDWLLGRLTKPLTSLEETKLLKEESEYQQRFAKHIQLADGLYLSEIWIEGGRDFLSSGRLKWNCPVGWICTKSYINGENFPFKQEDSQVDVFCPSIESNAKVDLWFSLDAQASANVSQDSLPQLQGTHSPGEILFVSTPSNRRNKPSGVLFERNAWVSMLSQQIPSTPNASDSRWLRYGAKELAELMWRSAEMHGDDKDTMSSVEFGKAAEVLFNLPWTTRDEYKQLIQSAQASVHSIKKYDSSETTLAKGTVPWDHRLVQTAFPLVVFSILIWIWNRYQVWFQNRNWWKLLGIAGLWWLIFADLWIPSLLALSAAILVIDSFWMLSVQFRQSGTLAPR